jgi:hypothetical protein
MGDSQLERELANAVDGEVRFDAGTRAAYSTDASNFRQVPVSVVVPRTVEAAEAAVAVCRKHDGAAVRRHPVLVRSDQRRGVRGDRGCGLAGNFGFQAGQGEVSRAIAERALLPKLRSASPGAVVLADGFSCRTQIHELDSGGREAVHLANAQDPGLTPRDSMRAHSSTRMRKCPCMLTKCEPRGFADRPPHKRRGGPNSQVISATLSAIRRSSPELHPCGAYAPSAALYFSITAAGTRPRSLMA